MQVCRSATVKKGGTPVAKETGRRGVNKSMTATV